MRHVLFNYIKGHEKGNENDVLVMRIIINKVLNRNLLELVQLTNERKNKNY